MDGVRGSAFLRDGEEKVLQPRMEIEKKEKENKTHINYPPLTHPCVPIHNARALRLR